MQAYSPRDPIQEYADGVLSTRQLALMVRWLPPGNAVEREARGHRPMSDRLLLDIANSLRRLVAIWSDGEAPYEEFAPFPGGSADEEDAENAAAEAAETAAAAAQLSAIWGGDRG